MTVPSVVDLPERHAHKWQIRVSPVRCTDMKTSDSVTLLDRFVMAALPTMLHINNGDIPDAVADAFEIALEVLRRRDEFHRQAADLLEGAAGGEGTPATA